MEQTTVMLAAIVKTTGLFAPALFIILHILRPFLFIPVAAVCVAGGVLFGPLAGAVYSAIGISFVSFSFYYLGSMFPKMFERLSALKQKWFGRRGQFSAGQITILRLLPFMHFHLLSLCIMESTKNFKDYMKTSIFANIPLAVVYTAFGGMIEKMAIGPAVLFAAVLAALFYVFRTKNTVFKWDEFFEARSVS
ncbi:TVP38/TMEM64 family protein [Bacillus marinisedimentorum]|uniref:TVP38/TMEM64 family protein n=1 Tax=Bacillus marinisedimentorum TaxID=1821260 RepID=UPI0008731E3D|nr:VTT domain-containing protein [Bacillus marinisedimentorum]